MKRVISLILVLLLVLGLSSLALARVGNRGYGMSGMMNGRSGMMGGIGGADCHRRQGRFTAEELDLTSEQEAAIEELKFEYHQKSEIIRNEMWEARAQLRELYYDSGVSDSELRALQNEVDSLRNELIELKDRQQLDLREILTAEQLERLERSSFLHCDEDYLEGRRSETRGTRGTRGSRASI